MQTALTSGGTYSFTFTVTRKDALGEIPSDPVEVKLTLPEFSFTNGHDSLIHCYGRTIGVNIRGVKSSEEDYYTSVGISGVTLPLSYDSNAELKFLENHFSTLGLGDSITSFSINSDTKYGFAVRAADEYYRVKPYKLEYIDLS
jgi:hypothetical protein